MTAAKGMLKAALSAQQNHLGRAEHDFYPTPAEVTRALVPEIADFPATISDPACGDGAIALELGAADSRSSAPTLCSEATARAESISLPSQCGAPTPSSPIRRSAGWRPDLSSTPWRSRCHTSRCC